MKCRVVYILEGLLARDCILKDKIHLRYSSIFSMLLNEIPHSRGCITGLAIGLIL